MPDIYFTKKYGKLNELIEDGQLKTFKYKNKYGSITHMFIIRKIAKKIGGVNYYDIITPYGYGGPLIKCNDVSNKKLLIKDFIKKFERYCLANNIVTEFIRFHPIFKNHLGFENYYDIEYLRNTLATDLKSYENPFQSELSRSARKNCNRALRDGVTYEVVSDATRIMDFYDIYIDTMDRNKANSFYYLPKEYFIKMSETLKDNILLVYVKLEDKLLAMGLYFKKDKYLHAHLSGTYSEYLHLSPAYIIKYAIIEWGKENGYDLIHHGGGTTNSKNDGLYKFKKRFAQNTEFEYHIGKKIWNEKIYEKLIASNKNSENIDFFPAYRNI